MKKIHVTKDAGIRATDENEENLLRQLTFRYLPYWPLFLILFLLGICAAYFYLKTVIPVYEISASILIKDEKKGSDDSKLMESLDLISSKKIVENEIEVIHSRTILSEVVKNLNLYAPLFEKGQFTSRPAYITSPIIVELRQPDSITPVKKVQFIYSDSNHTVIAENKIYPLNKWMNSEWGVIRFNSNALYRPSSEKHAYYFRLDNLKKAVNDLSEKLEITPSGKLSSVIDLVLKDEVPERGESVVNDVIDVYNKVSITDKKVFCRQPLIPWNSLTKG